MIMARRLFDGYIFEARQLNEQHPYNNTTKWIVDNGLPWLTGNVEEPWTLEDPNGLRGQPGIFISPLWGDLVIRNHARRAMHAAIGDWILFDPIAKDFWIVKPTTFAVLYERL